MEKMENQRISVKEAAKILGVGEAEIRYQMDKKNLQIGKVMPPKHKGGNRRYLIFKPLVMELLGLTEWPTDEKGD